MPWGFQDKSACHKGVSPPRLRQSTCMTSKHQMLQHMRSGPMCRTTHNPADAYRWQVCDGCLVDVCQAPAEAKATQLEAAVFIQEDVGGLDVTVDDGVGMKELWQQHQHRQFHSTIA